VFQLTSVQENIYNIITVIVFYNICFLMGGAEQRRKKMKKKIIGILVMTLLIATAISVTGSNENNNRGATMFQEDCENIITVYNINNGDRLDQEQNNISTEGIDKAWGWARYSGKFAQSFVPTLPILTRVELYIATNGNPDDLYITIRDELIGEDLTFTNIGGSLYENKSWVFFDFDDISINPGQKYYIIWQPNGNSQNNAYSWIHGHDDPYEKGKPWSNDEMEVWTIFEDASEYYGFPKIDFCFRTYGYSNPPSNPEITGTISGKAGTEYEYSLVSSEPDGDDIYYYIDWGDGDNEEWVGPFTSDVKQTFTHTWTEQNNYVIKGKSRDEYGFESEWTTLEISMPKNKAIHHPFLDFLQEHPYMFPLLRQILKLQ